MNRITFFVVLAVLLIAVGPVSGWVARSPSLSPRFLHMHGYRNHRLTIPTHEERGLLSLQCSNANKRPSLTAVSMSSSSSGGVEDTSLPSLQIHNGSAQLSLARDVAGKANLLYRFSRPHTIKGTLLASLMAVVRVFLDASSSSFSCSIAQFARRVSLGVFALLCGNLFIVGLNQIYDVEIDKINKPFLPIAAELLKPATAWPLIISAAAIGLSTVYTQFSRVIFNLYLLGIVLGTAYSLPPLQLKRFPFFACSTIAVVRGFLLNFGLYYAVRETLGVPFRWNPVVVFISAFMTFFAATIAITKDLSDVEGDKKYAISTFASRHGVKTTAVAASVLLSLCYVVAMVLPFIFPSHFKLAMTALHIVPLVLLWKSVRELDENDAQSIRRFYKTIWNLFYLQYVIYCFV